MRVLGSLFIAAALMSPAQVTAVNSCILPVADYNETEPSPANLQGQIIRVRKGVIDVMPLVRVGNHIVKSNKGKRNAVPVRFNARTDMFSVFGGFVEPQELAKGQRVFVWFVGCSPKRAGAPPLAAVIQLCSTAPEDCLR